MENLEQGSASWHEWRERGIGASEAVAIMGDSPYLTFLQWWEIRTKRRPKQETTFQMTRGTNMEPKARACFELEYNIEMIPTLAEHADYPFIKASLDGYNPKLNVALEIKCCGKKNFEIVKSGQCPKDYFAQIQQQILVTGVHKVYLWAFNGEVGACLEILPDVAYCKKLLDQLIHAWALVQTDTPPEADPSRDYEVIKDEALESYISQWKNLKIESDSLKQDLESLEEKIRSGLQVNRGLCNGVRLTKSQRKGSIVYKNIPVLSGLDLEQYRGKPMEVFSIKMIK